MNDAIAANSNPGPCLTTELDGIKRMFPLTFRVNKIGSGKRNHVILRGKGITENHACITFQMGRYRLLRIDHGNLRVNGVDVISSVQLSHGDRIDIGTVPAVFIEKGPPAPAPSAPSSDLSATLSEVNVNEVLRLFSGIVKTVTELLEVNDHKRTAVRLVEIVAHLMKCDGVRLLIRRENGTIQELAAFPQSAFEGRFSKTVIQWSEKEGRTVLVSDIRNEAGLPFEESLLIKDILSVLCAPLGREKDRRVGFLYLDRLNGHAPFTTIDREFFEELRALFSNLLDNVVQKEAQAEAIKALSVQAMSADNTALIFQCPEMEQVIQKSVKIAFSDIPVLIESETGTGKELLARLIHKASRRNSRPFIAINCGAIPEHLMESQFFGHEKGAFTGAETAKIGYMTAAHEGTLFLDEICDLPINLQVKLLRALQQKEVMPLGAFKAVSADCRIIAATNRPLDVEVAAGRFRQDLFFRINVGTLTIPPLRERGRDIILLAHHFIKRFSVHYGLSPKTLSGAAEKALVAYHWPGNVRELENIIQKAMVFSQTPSIRPEDLDIRLPVQDASVIETMETVRSAAERKAVRKALAASKGNVSFAGKMLSMDRSVLIHLLEKQGIDPREFKPGPAQGKKVNLKQ
jgi:DNA-binding NtrC family response regulator